MRIVHLTSSLCAPLGGAEAYCVALASAQAADQQLEVIVATPWIDGETRAALEESGVEVIVRKAWRPYRPDQRGTSALTKVLFHLLDAFNSVWSPRGFRVRHLGSDILHVHRFQGLGSAILRGSRRRRVVHTVHDFSLVDTNSTSVRDGADRPSLIQRARAWLNSLSARQADAILFPSQRTLDRHLQSGMSQISARARVVPLGWTLDSVEGVITVPGRFVFLGKLTQTKGIGVALDAWRQADLGDDAEFLVAGDGELVEDVRRAGAGVKFVGWMSGEEKARMIRSAWALVFPSQWPENYPLVVAEAMIAGVPIVTNSLAGGPLSRHGETAFVGPSTSSYDLAMGLKALWPDFGLRDQLADGARKVGRGIGMEAHAAYLLRVYEEVVGL